MKLLVVEDENKTADYVRQGLMEAGFVVDLARNGLDGHHLAMGETYDLVVLDVMLPDVDGWRIVRALRDAGKQVPVLFLTARGGVDDRVKGLELGADDYLVKPFAFSELLARVRTLLRRGSAPSQPDPARRQRFLHARRPPASHRPPASVRFRQSPCFSRFRDGGPNARWRSPAR